MKTIVCVSLATSLLVPSVQDAAEDWSLHRDDRRKTLMSSTSFDNGLHIAVRCNDGGLEAFMAGLPEAPAPTEQRTIGIAFGDDPLHDEYWSVAVDERVAVSRMPAPFARRLREGGRLDVLIPGGAEGGRNLRYRMDLPASNAAIDQVLTACGKPLVDPRDAELADMPEGGLPSGVNWVERPRPQYPGNTRYARGFAFVTCLTNPDGALRDCVIETEHPRDGGFGDSTLRALRRAQVATEGRGPVPVIRVGFQTNFVMDGYQTREERDRMREQTRQLREQRRASSN